MALKVTELRNGKFFKEGKDVFLVLVYEHIKTGRGSGNIKVKVRNVRTGAVTEKSFMTGAKVDGANTEKRKTQFLYQDGDTFNFMDPVSFEQFSVPVSTLGNQTKYLKDGLDVVLLVSDGEVLGLELPMSLIYVVAETGPGEKGNTVSNVFKEATMDNGLIVRVPMFIKVGTKIKVDTKLGEYVERAK
ncbi:elongation factor P [Patescibacteria group bacterium]|nr:elongation factor P [Patescibacteria group bacterium]